NIAAGQSFMVTASASGGTMKFDNSMRVSGNNTQFFKTMGNGPLDLERHRIWISLSNSEGAYNQMLVGYIEGATNEKDLLYDGEQMSVGTVSIYTILGNTNLSIQGRSLPFSNADIVPIGYSSIISGSLTIRLAELDGLFAHQDVYLLDKVANIYHNLKASDYNFITTSGTFNDRFELRYVDQTLDTEPITAANPNVKINKVQHQLMVSCTSASIAKVEVYDLLGKLLFIEKDINSNVFQTELKDLATQLGLVRVTLDNQQVVVKKIMLD
ncbi:MAG: hypothetical protein ABUL44_01250, partial [Flavobacterium sp.]